MGLSDMQRTLARLLTDAEARDRFCADPQACGQAWGLEADDIAQLRAFVMSDVERFARSLCAKRWNEIEKLLPLSARAANRAGFPLARLFYAFAQQYTPQGSKRHAQDAMAFAAHLARQPASTFTDNDGASLAWLPEVARYEAAWLSANLDMRPRFCFARVFRFPVHRLAKALAHDPTGCAPLASLTGRPTLVVWHRLSPRGKPLHVIFKPPPTVPIRSR